MEKGSLWRCISYWKWWIFVKQSVFEPQQNNILRIQMSLRWPFSQPGDNFLQGGRGGWRWGYLWPGFFCCFFGGGRFWEGSDSDLPFLELDGKPWKTSLKICWWTKLLHQHIQHMLHQETINCLCFSTFLQPDFSGWAVHPTYPAHPIPHCFIASPEAPPASRSIAEGRKGAWKQAERQSQQISLLVVQISGIHIGIPKWKHVPLTPLCGMILFINSSLDSDNHCKDIINHRAIGLISIPSSFGIANKNQVYHPDYLDQASCAIVFLRVASCGPSKWAPYQP